MNKIGIKIKFKPTNPLLKLPEYKTEQAAGMDVQADIINSVLIEPFDRVLIPTGIYMHIPQGYEVQVRPRSGLALKHGITLLNTPGTIDSDYRGELKIILYNASKQSYVINPGERIAQIVVAQVTQIVWEEVIDLEESARGENGFGHTGK